MGQRKTGKYSLIMLELVMFIYTFPSTVRISDILHTMRCSPGNLYGKAGLLSYLEREGFIERTKKGKREYMIKLTEKGRLEAELLAKSELAKGLIRK
jgi:DNA-binding PadR family transcriptional regulator